MTGRRRFQVLAVAFLAALTFSHVAFAAVPSPPEAPPPPASKDQVSIGGNIDIAAGQSVRDVVCVGCSVTVEGSVERDLVVVAGTALVSGSVGRDVTVVGGGLTLASGAAIGRDAVSVGGSLSADPGSRVGRDHTSVGVPFGHFWPPIIPLLTFVGLAVLLLLVFPTQLGTARLLLERRPFASFGLGCAGVLAALGVASILALTIFLIPVSLAILGVLVAGWAFGWAALFLSIGERLLDAAGRRGTPLFALLAGGLLFSLPAFVPLLFVPVAIFGGTFAVGAALGSRFGTRTSQEDLLSWSVQPVAAPAAPPPAAPPDL